jgi:hypothetical protein
VSDHTRPKRTFSFRFLTLPDEAKFLAKVKELGTTPSDLARDLIGMGIDRAEEHSETADRRPEILPAVPDGIRRLIVKAAWATIVALSPDLDEDRAAEFLRGVFGEFE